MELLRLVGGREDAWKGSELPTAAASAASGAGTGWEVVSVSMSSSESPSNNSSLACNEGGLALETQK